MKAKIIPTAVNHFQMYFNVLFLIPLIFINGISFAFGQGLEDVIVETYYVTDVNDGVASGTNTIRANSVTYRIFIDMKPGYMLQSVYGSPGHELKISTTTFFYNHPIHGSHIPNLVMDPVLAGGPLMLDSWIGTGAGSQQKYAVLKSDDDTVNTVQNLSDPVMLQNESMAAGIPLKQRDGLVKLSGLPPKVTQIGLDTLLDALHRVNLPDTGFVFTTENGGWGCIGGASGAVPNDNKVLIAQLTTDGDFYFEFNIQIGSAEHGVEQYVARNPRDGERLHHGLIISRKAFQKELHKNN